MTIPRLNGWLDELQPGIQAGASMIQNFLAPDAGRVHMLQQAMSQDPDIVQKLSNMTPDQRQAYLQSMQIRNRKMSDSIMGMQPGFDLQRQQELQGALGNLDESGKAERPSRGDRGRG